MRKKSFMLSEKEAVQDVLRAERELADGKIIRGDLREIIKNQYLSKKEAVLLSVGDHEVYDK